MTPEEQQHTADLEARLAALELRDQRREAEHAAMLETRREVERQYARDYELFASAHDKRIAEIAAGVVRNEDGKVAIDASVFVQGMLDLVDGIAARMRRIEGTCAELSVNLNQGNQNDKDLEAALQRAADRYRELLVHIEKHDALLVHVQKMGEALNLIMSNAKKKLAALGKMPPDPRVN